MVVPIGVIVAVAIVCIVVAVLSSAQRADEVAVEHEKQLFSGALANYGRSVLSEVDSVASSQSATQNIRRKFDPLWAEQRAGAWLAAYFKHDYILVFDGQDNPVYSMVGQHAADKAWFTQARPDLIELINFMRGRSLTMPGVIQLGRPAQVESGAQVHAMAIRNILGQPAAVAAVAVGSDEGISTATDTAAPIMLSVKFISTDVLAGIASQLGLVNLRAIDAGPVPEGDFVYELNAPNGETIGRFAWTAKQPGAEIVQSVVPFIAVALAGFALLAAFVLRYMRRTAVAIAAGETRLRHLALHDPLCGLPNRIFFGERLEAVIGQIHSSKTPSAVFYIDLDHFKDVNDTLGHPVGDELIRNVTLRLSHTLRGGDLVARLGGDEFAVISSIGGDTSKVMAMAQRIITAICAPYSVNGHNIVIGASIGIAVIDRDC